MANYDNVIFQLWIGIVYFFESYSLIETAKAIGIVPFDYLNHQVTLVRMRMGESNRAIAVSGLMGRNKARELKKIAEEQAWLNHSSQSLNIICTSAGKCIMVGLLWSEYPFMGQCYCSE